MLETPYHEVDAVNQRHGVSDMAAPVPWTDRRQRGAFRQNHKTVVNLTAMCTFSQPLPAPCYVQSGTETTTQS